MSHAVSAPPLVRAQNSAKSAKSLTFTLHLAALAASLITLMGLPTTLVVRSATRAVWETSMDGVAVVLSAILRFSLFPRNNYADSDRICAQLEKTRLRRAGSAQVARHDGEVASAHHRHHRPLHRLAPDDVFVVDARRPDEFNHSHVYSAVNCHYSEVAAVEALFETHGVRKNQCIVVYCAVGLRSGWVARKLRKRGYVNAATLYGGYYHWGAALQLRILHNV